MPNSVALSKLLLLKSEIAEATLATVPGKQASLNNYFFNMKNMADETKLGHGSDMLIDVVDG